MEFGCSWGGGGAGWIGVGIQQLGLIPAREEVVGRVAVEGGGWEGGRERHNSVDMGARSGILTAS